MISQPEIAILRSLKKTAIILLLMFRLDKPIGRDEMAEILDIDPRTVKNHLNSLLHFGLITRTHYQNGYMLSQYGRQMILGQITQDLAHLPVALKDPPEALLSKIQVLPEAHKAHEPAQALLPIDDELDQRGTICASTQFVLKEEDEEEEYINLITSSSGLNKNCNISMQKLLKASPLLFGEPGVIGDNLPERCAEVVLGWLAHAYQQRHRLRSPAGLVYSQLKKGNLPGENYLEHPETYLPFDYLIAVEYKQTPLTESEIVEIEDAGLVETPMEDPSLDILIYGKINARQAWNTVLMQLSLEMPKASFDIWLAGTKALRWSDNCLIISASNAYACDWLKGRLTSKVVSMLGGILMQKVDVRFMIE